MDILVIIMTLHKEQVLKCITFYMRGCLPVCVSSEINFIFFCSLDRFNWRIKRVKLFRLTLNTRAKIFGQEICLVEDQTTKRVEEVNIVNLYISNSFVRRLYLWRKAQVTGYRLKVIDWGILYTDQDWHPHWYAFKLQRNCVVSTPWTISSALPGLWSDTTFSVKPSVSRLFIISPPLSIYKHFITHFPALFFFIALISICIPHILLNYFPILLPVVSWSLLTIVCKSRLLNIQLFCKLVVKLAVVGRGTPWKLTNATNWGLFFFRIGLPAHHCPH